ncbi:MAG TPA: LacI family DNA-binding transcriptional regulator [Trueperaceae bacterium]|nr:LacI family DNA-binding transcriptional regulator [Trueperaceae bacterium]
MRATIKDVATRANVGIATVSRVLNDELNVADSTRLRVLAACQELGYTRNNLARSLKTGATDNIGVAIMSRHAPVILNPFYAVVIGGIEQALEDADKHLLLSSLRRREELLDLAREGRVDGLLVVGCDIADSELIRLRDSGRPVVLIDNSFEGLPSVGTDNHQGGRLAAEHLLAAGCKRPAFVAENLDNPNFRQRLAGFREALEEAGVALLATGIAEGGDGWDGGYYAMRRVLDTGLVPDGVLAANDPAALSALRALHQAGLAVPADVKLIGFDDIYLAAQAEPALTTVRVEKQELGRRGAALLLDLLAGRAMNTTAVLKTTLVTRASA